MPVVTFTDSAGVRHKDVELPASLVRAGVSRRQQEQYLIKSGIIRDPSAPELPALVDEVIQDVQAESQAAAFSAVEQLRQQLDELQGKLDGQPLSHAELVAAREEITNLMLKAADANSQLVQVEGRGSQIKAELTAIAEPIAQQVAVTAEQQAEVAEVQQRVLSDLQAQAAALLEALSQDAASALSEAEQQALTTAAEVATKTARITARDVAASFRPSSVTIAPAAEDPRNSDPDNWAMKHYGFEGGFVAGDGVFLTSKNGITPLVFKGPSLGWVEGAELLPKVITATGPSVLDASTKVNAPITINKGGGGGGGAGGEALLANRMGIGGSTVLADSSNWGGIHDPLSGVLELDIRALDGTAQGRSAVCIAAFTWDGAANDKWTEYALLGDLSSVIQVNLSIQRGNATLPAAGGLLPITIPPGSQALRIFATIQYVPGAGTAGATQFSVRGSVSWNFESDGRPLDVTQSGKQPLWIWS
jgi:hypothetical protein